MITPDIDYEHRAVNRQGYVGKRMRGEEEENRTKKAIDNALPSFRAPSHSKINLYMFYLTLKKIQKIKKEKDV